MKSFKSKNKRKVAKKSSQMSSGFSEETPGPCGVPTATLKVPGGFIWDSSALQDDNKDNTSEEEEILEEMPKKKKKLNRRQETLTAEKQLREMEKRRQDPDYQPETVLEFEELLQKNPNSYKNWIMYSCFHLSNAEMEKAKTILRRSLDIMPFEDETGRLKIWRMILKIEVNFGTTRSAQEAFKDALSRNNDLKIYEMMADIYSDAGKEQEVETVMKSMLKKYSQRSEVWIKAAIFYFERNLASEARDTIDKSKISVPKRDHVNIMNRAAQLEFKHGDVERGKILFETLLAENPKRLDIWFVYSDLLIKAKDTQGARQLLNRMTGLNLRTNKMKSVFNKYQQFEERHGTPSSVDGVRRKVADYVMSLKYKDN